MQKVENIHETPHDGKPLLCAGAVSKDGISLIHGDSLQALKSYGDNYFDVAIVDPPYGIGDTFIGFSSGAKKGKLERVHKEMKWDDNIPSEEYFAELKRVSKNQIIWGANNFELPTSEYFIIWQKSNAEDFSFAMCEMAWTNCKVPAKVFKKLHISVDDKNKIHPTQKPIELYAWLLDRYAKPNDLILDTHLGSGSSRIAAYKGGFNFVGFEIDSEYYQKQEKRFNEFKSQLRLF